VTDFLDQKRAEITKRLNELRPLVDEFHQLEAAASALRGVKGSRNSTGSTTRRRPGRPRGSRTTTRAAGATATRTRTTRRRATTTGRRATTTGRRAASTATRRTARRPGRRKGSGARAAQTLELVKAQSSGITIPELAAKMGIKQNYLYRVLPGLQKEGKVRKRGRSWYPKAA
jgi:hypothetical protein